MRTVLACLLTALVCAGEPLPPDAVARVGGTAITIGHLSRELLRREGADGLVDWVRGHIERLDWDALPDDAVVMAAAGHELRKRDLAALLMRDKGAAVREQLIDIAVVEQALAAAGIVIDDAVLAVEFRLMERAFQRKAAAKGQGHVDFASYLKAKEGQSVADFLAQPAVRMLAGLHQLVRREVRAEATDAALQARLDAERARWDQRAGVDLSVIHLPWRRDEQGRVTQEESVRLQSVGNLLHRQLATGEVPFAKVWDAFGKAWDASGADGRIGWVDAEGRREEETARRIPKGVVERAFAAEGPFPRLLPPHAHEGGVDLALVHGKRPARRVELAEVRERLLEDQLERELEARTKALVQRLRQAATIEYGSLPSARR